MIDSSKISALAGLFCAMIVALISWINNISFSSLCIRASVTIILVYFLVHLFINELNKFIDISNKEIEKKNNEALQKQQKEMKEKMNDSNENNGEDFMEMQFEHIYEDDQELVK